LKDTSDLYKGPYESGLLKLNCDKALFDLDWKSTLNFDQTVKYTAEWYKNYYNSNKDIKFFTEEQIVDFTNIAKKKNICWAFESKI
jgi:CDP-glucose 4,6-dehydratase